MQKLTERMELKMTVSQKAFLDGVAAKHKTTGPDLIRGLIDAAAEFYAAHGWFSFPVKITPEMFQVPTSTGATRGATVTTPTGSGSVETRADFSKELTDFAHKRGGVKLGGTAGELREIEDRARKSTGRKFRRMSKA